MYNLNKIFHNLNNLGYVSHYPGDPRYVICSSCLGVGYFGRTFTFAFILATEIKYLRINPSKEGQKCPLFGFGVWGLWSGWKFRHRITYIQLTRIRNFITLIEKLWKWELFKVLPQKLEITIFAKNTKGISDQPINNGRQKLTVIGRTI